MHEEIEIFVHSFVKALPATDSKLEEIRQKTAVDHKLKALRKTNKEHWPSNWKSCSNTIVPYWNIHQDFSMHNGLICKGSRTVIPTLLQENILWGFAFFILKNRQNKAENSNGSLLAWHRKIDQGMYPKVQCLHSNKSQQPKRTNDLHTTSSPILATVRCDLFEWNGKDYMITIDYCWLDILTSTTATHV